MAAELNGPKPCVTEADEEGWMIVNLPGKSDPFKDSGAFRRLALGGGHGDKVGNQQGQCAMHPYCQTHNTALHENVHFLPLCYDLGHDKASFWG